MVEITHKDLLDKITYFPEEGYFVYNRNNKTLKYGTDPKFGFKIYSITIGNKNLSIAGHNLAWWWMKGERPPKHYVKFEDGDNSNIKWNNLKVRDYAPKPKRFSGKMGEGVLTKEDLLNLFDYDRENGLLYWKKRKVTKPCDKVFNAQFAGKKAGADHGGYRKIRLWDTYDIFIHRIVWCIETGDWPEDQVDHINHIRDDNRFENLRAVTQVENSRNCTRSSNNTTGVTGVTLTKSGKYRVRVNTQEKEHIIGIYSTIAEAKTARDEAYKEIGFHENHGAEKEVEY